MPCQLGYKVDLAEGECQFACTLHPCTVHTPDFSTCHRHTKACVLAKFVFMMEAYTSKPAPNAERRRWPESDLNVPALNAALALCLITTTTGEVGSRSPSPPCRPQCWTASMTGASQMVPPEVCCGGCLFRDQDHRTAQIEISYGTSSRHHGLGAPCGRARSEVQRKCPRHGHSSRHEENDGGGIGCTPHRRTKHVC